VFILTQIQTGSKKLYCQSGNLFQKERSGSRMSWQKNLHANVHLISLNKMDIILAARTQKVLMASYQYLKDITNIPIECRTVLGNNLATATVQYAENIGADLYISECRC
jgi:hypothetical protein